MTRWRTVQDILAGPMFAKLSFPADEPQDHAAAARVLWAVIQLEALEFLHKNGSWADSTAKEPPLLALLEHVPVKLLEDMQNAGGAQDVQSQGAYVVVSGTKECSWLTRFQTSVLEVLMVNFSRMQDLRAA